MTDITTLSDGDLAALLNNCYAETERRRVLDPAARATLSRAEDRFSESTCQVLSAVLRASEPVTVAELRQATGLSRSHLGTVLQRLEGAGFIVRVRRATYERSPQTHVLPSIHL